MRKFVLTAVVVAIGLAACAQPPDSVPITVTHEGRAKALTNTDVAATRARDNSRAPSVGTLGTEDSAAAAGSTR